MICSSPLGSPSGIFRKEGGLIPPKALCQGLWMISCCERPLPTTLSKHSPRMLCCCLLWLRLFLD